MKASDGRFQCQWIEYDGKNIKDISHMIADYSIPSLSVTDENEKGEKYIVCAYPYRDAFEEYPEVGDIYAVHLDTQEVYLYTNEEFHARFKVM